METKELLDLARTYTESVENAARHLQAHLGEMDLLAAANNGRVARQGALRPDGSYRFHGVGCRVRLGDLTVNFDFGPGGRVGGFDAFRLCEFAQATGRNFDRDEIAAGLLTLLQEGVLEKPNAAPSEHLLYWKTEAR